MTANNEEKKRLEDALEKARDTREELRKLQELIAGVAFVGGAILSCVVTYFVGGKAVIDNPWSTKGIVAMVAGLLVFGIALCVFGHFYGKSQS